MLLVKSLWRRIENQTMIRHEHFVPRRGLDLEGYLKRGHRTAVHHLLRYTWASRMLADFGEQGSVLDVACGAGYGTYMMAAEHPGLRFLGVDYDPGAVKSAAAAYRLPNLDYRAGDVLQWTKTIGAGQFDTVVSFDTLEHVPHREIMMENLVDHLRPDGKLLLSTPCGHSENQLRPRWTGHQIEFSSASLYDFLSRYFRTVIRPDQGDLPHLEVFDVLKGSRVVYMLRMNPVLCMQPITIANPYREGPLSGTGPSQEQD